MLGDRAWWLPAWLDRLLPNVSLEGRREPLVGQPQPAAAAAMTAGVQFAQPVTADPNAEEERAGA